MSGLVGIVNLDGAPVEQPLLESLTDVLRGRGPDRAGTWIGGNVGLGHTLLRTTPESDQEAHQPGSLGGDVWITADARVDAQDELTTELRSSGRLGQAESSALDSASDEQLILLAYLVWGERCVEHLLGDFAFAIWDGPRHRLFCARDQLGVNPLFYAVVGSRLVFASEPNCVRLAPGTPDALDDLAIAEFLLFGESQQLDATAYSAVRRLPPAHVLIWSHGRPRVSRYWDLAIPTEIRARPQQCRDRFDQVLKAAVADRLRTDQVAISFSGGIDSPLLAAEAQRLLHSGGQPFGLHAHTLSCELVFRDPEPRFAAIAAEALGIPLRTHLVPDEPWLDGAEQSDWTASGPSLDSHFRSSFEMTAAAAADARVLLTGFDGDALCTVWFASHFRGLLKKLDWARAVADASRLTARHRMLPPLGLRARWRAPGERRAAAATFPRWLNEDLVRRFDLPARWQAHVAPCRPPDRHPRVDAADSFRSPQLTGFFDFCDRGRTRSAISVRHPLLDLRVIELMLTLPPIPWLADKALLRDAARARGLPRAITARPKSPLAADIAKEQITRSGASEGSCLGASSALDPYLAVSEVPSLAEAVSSDDLWPVLYAHELGLWLRASP